MYITPPNALMNFRIWYSIIFVNICIH